jgi:hypothetical protein
MDLNSTPPFWCGKRILFYLESYEKFTIFKNYGVCDDKII